MVRTRVCVGHGCMLNSNEKEKTMKLKFRFAIWTATICPFSMLATITNTALAEPSAEGPEAAADALHAAIAAGDTQGIEDILDPEVLIFESGGVESSLEEYASHHMHSDMEFMAGMEREVLTRDVIEAGDMAVVSTRSRLSGSFRDRELDLFSTETLGLAKTEGGWWVRRILWSSPSTRGTRG